MCVHQNGRYLPIRRRRLFRLVLSLYRSRGDGDAQIGQVNIKSIPLTKRGAEKEAHGLENATVFSRKRLS